MAKKNIIEIDYDFDFQVWGIVSTLRDYQLCWQINKALNLKLSRIKDLEFSNPQRGKHLLFSIFRFESEVDKCIFHLISNKFYNEYLIPEIKEADYLFRFSGDVPEQYIADIQTKLKNLSGSIAIINLEAGEIKSRHNLIVD